MRLRRILFLWRKRKVLSAFSDLVQSYEDEGLRRVGLTEEEILGLRDMDSFYRVLSAPKKDFRKDFEHLMRIVKGL